MGFGPSRMLRVLIDSHSFTLRERDSMAQKRITEAELFALLDEHVY